METLDDVDIKDDVDAELEVDTLTEKNRQSYITMSKSKCVLYLALITLSCFNLIVSARRTQFLDKVDTLDFVDNDENVDNEFQVE